MDKWRKKTKTRQAKTPTLINDYSLTQSWLTLNVGSETLVSLFQLRKGNSNQTFECILTRAVARWSVVPGSAVPSAAVGLPAWGIAALVMVASNLRPNANQKVIENSSQALRHLRGTL